MIKQFYTALIYSQFVLVTTSLLGQPYTDYIGAGHNRGVIVKTSNDHDRFPINHVASGMNTLNGQGMTGELLDMVRFLSQASFGCNKQELKDAVALGKEVWLEEQFSLPESSLVQKMNLIAKQLYDYHISNGADSSEVSINPSWTHLRYAWWDNVVFNKDQLRQRMSFALSQIFVVSDESNLGGFAEGLGAYYDLLSKHAFGNFRDLIYDVTMSPVMGFYLSHLNNPKAIPEENIHPDQNYAREIMQLFTIGLYELNEDGTYKKDIKGDLIPTYTNQDIQQLANVFTGLGIGKNLPDMGDIYFGSPLYGADLSVAMKMYENWHEPSEKILLGKYLIPSNQQGLTDINQALDIIFNHPNVGPFISKRLIQRFVTSNPSPQYISRVTQVFNNDGSNVRGNLRAVIKAILLDEEATSCASFESPTFGKLKEPVLRQAQFFRALGVIKPSPEIFLHLGYELQRAVFQHPLSSPSVFNFYLPDYMPTGILGDQSLSAPEFQILNTLTSINYANMIHGYTFYEGGTDNWDDYNLNSRIDIRHMWDDAMDDETLINNIDLIFCHGSLSNFTRGVVKEALADIRPTANGILEKINTALWLILISPDYVVQK